MRFRKKLFLRYLTEVLRWIVITFVRLLLVALNKILFYSLIVLQYCKEESDVLEIMSEHTHTIFSIGMYKVIFWMLELNSWLDRKKKKPSTVNGTTFARFQLTDLSHFLYFTVVDSQRKLLKSPKLSFILENCL